MLQHLHSFGSLRLDSRAMPCTFIGGRDMQPSGSVAEPTLCGTSHALAHVQTCWNGGSVPFVPFAQHERSPCCCFMAVRTALHVSPGHLLRSVWSAALLVRRAERASP